MSTTPKTTNDSIPPNPHPVKPPANLPHPKMTATGSLVAPRYTIFPSKDNKTGVIRYAFKDEKPMAEEVRDGISYGTRLYCFTNGSFLIIENATDAITVCALLNQIEKNTTK